MALGQHIRLQRRDSSVIAATPREQRIVARAVLERGERFGLLAFSAADTHLHMEATCDHDAGREYARQVEMAVTKRLGTVGFALARVDPIRDQWHLHNLCDYILRQDRRHRVESLDPLRECSNLPDLLGARLLGAYTLEHLRRALPRFCRDDFLRLIGVPRLQPADGPLHLLPESAAAAACCPELRGRCPRVVAARIAAVHAADKRASRAAVARALGVSRRTVHRLLACTPDPALVWATRLQLGLRRARDMNARLVGCAL